MRVVGCAVNSFLLPMVPDVVICLFCFCRLARLLECLVKILYLMVVPFWFTGFPELSLKSLNWLHIIRSAFGSSVQVFLSLSVYKLLSTCLHIRICPKMTGSHLYLVLIIANRLWFDPMENLPFLTSPKTTFETQCDFFKQVC